MSAAKSSTVLVIGAGGVSSVCVHKMAFNPDIFPEIHLASRTKSKCDAIAASVKERCGRDIATYEIDAEEVPAMVNLIRKTGAGLVVNLALPYQDLPIMDACLEAGVDYLDTANYEPKDEAKFEYKWQWAYQDRFKDAGLMALLGSGFDPGVTNVFCAYAQKHLFDTIETIDIMDANAGDHGYKFATNFNPEINIREITQRGRFWEKGEWKETDPLSVKWVYDYPVVGPKDSYLLYHEELESLALNIKGLKRIRFFMTFSENYLTHLRVLENVGMTRTIGIEQGLALVAGFENDMGIARIKVDMLAIAANGNTVLTERVDHMINAAGETFVSLRLMGIFEVQDGKIVCNTRSANYSQDMVRVTALLESLHA